MPQPTPHDLSKLLSLEHQVREQKTLQDFGFFVVNETHSFIPYHTALLWNKNSLNKPEVIALSGVAQVDKDSILTQWLNTAITELIKITTAPKIHTISKTDFRKAIQENWPNEIPDHLLWCPFFSEKQEITGGMLFSDPEPWNEEKNKKADLLLQSYAYSWAFLRNKKNYSQYVNSFFNYKNPILLLLIIPLLIALFFPVKQTVLAPAEVIAEDPIVITAPLQGVIKKFHVKPNQPVKKDQLLFSMDKTDLENAHQLAMKQLEIANSKYRQILQRGFKETETRTTLGTLKTESEEKGLEAQYTQILLQKTDVRSPINGIAVFDHPNDWIGQPVVTGEKVMLIAYPKESELEIWLPVSDAINFDTGTKVKFYPLDDPLNSIQAEISQTSFDAQITKNQTLAYRLIADFDSQEGQLTPRLGIQGTAKLYGKKVTFFYYLLRRPLTALRQYLGW